NAAGGGIEGRIQGERAVAVVLEAVAFGASGRERQDGIETIQGLNGGLLIDAEHGRVLRRAQIEAEDVGGFGFELGIVAGQVAFETVRLQARFLPSVITSKAANSYHFKTGQQEWPSGTENVLPCRLLWWQVGFGAPA